jgi:pilus assembly protein CpaC
MKGHSMQTNMTKQAVAKKRTRVLAMVLGGAIGVLAMVNTTVAQPAQNPQPATNQPSASTANRGTAVNDLITDGLTDGKLNLAVNKTGVITTRAAIKRVVIGQPDVIRDNEIGPNTILITALKPGTTQLIVWDDADRSQAVDVSVGYDLIALQDQYKSMFAGSQIKVATVNGAIALSGRVNNLETAKQAIAMAEPYGHVLNFLEVSGGQQVQLAVKFAEVSRSATSQLGVNFGTSDGRSFFGNNTGQVNPVSVLPTGTGDIASGDLAATAANSAISIFGKGVVGKTAFQYFINALRQNNVLRVLAEPNVMAISGQEASFLAGGEFPIPVTQGGSGAGGTAVTVEYREFGVKLKMTPIVLGDGRIRLKVAPEVSDLDFTTAVRFNGFVVPGLTSRKVETVVELNEGQTFAIAGLLNNNITAQKDVTPLLGDIPVLGTLFRSVRYQRKETELVVLVTPQLVEAMNPDQVPSVPGERWRDPNELELFLNQDIGGPASDLRAPASQPMKQAPLYHGTHGYSFDIVEQKADQKKED